MTQKFLYCLSTQWILAIRPNENWHSYKDSYKKLTFIQKLTFIHTSSTFTTVPKCEQSECLSAGKLIEKKMWYTHTLEEYSPIIIIKKTQATGTTLQVNLKNNVLSRRSISKIILYSLICYLYISFLLLFGHSVTSSSLQPRELQMPGFPVLHHLPELAQTHVHWVSGAIQLPQPLPPLSSFAFNLSHHQDLFQLVNSSHQMAKVLELHHQSFQWIFRVDFL